ncbi:hypothetical protein [Nostoc punctiforme]|uniref:hypothetical protein n=1 Tax=Nostoc punctiforme TaxID=272131 RepID=UPI000045BE5F|nr:hypothetical protein [Nostoc punctiforme]
MTDKIIERILAAADTPNLLDILTNRLSLSDLQSLLLEVYRRHAASLTPSDILKQSMPLRKIRSKVSSDF